jgi:hypothetical protein
VGAQQGPPERVRGYYISDGLSNARAESVNGLMKKVMGVGHGFRNLDYYRRRLLLDCGGITWQHHSTAKLLKRASRNVA